MSRVTMIGVLLAFVAGEVFFFGRSADAQQAPPTIRRVRRVRSIQPTQPVPPRPPVSVDTPPTGAGATPPVQIKRIRRARVRSVVPPGQGPTVRPPVVRPPVRPPPPPVTPPPRRGTYPISILAKIDGARPKLEKLVVLLQPGQRHLALVHLQSGAEAIVTVDAAGHSLTRGFTTEVVVKNGINSTYKVAGGWAVVGLKQRLSNGSYMVYAPYSPELDVREVRERGMAHIETVAKAALKRIKDNNVRLRARWTDEFMIRTVTCLALIEHIDPGDFTRGITIERLVNKVLTVVGANRGHAYGHNRSHAGAQGLMQIMPGTYRDIRSGYRLGTLVPESATGSRDHTTAMVIAVLLNDSNRALLGENVQFLPEQNDLNVCQWLASAYNCGGGRSLRTLRASKKEWARKLHFEEARIYVKKLSAVWKLLFT